MYEENSKGNITFGICVDEKNIEAYKTFTENKVIFGFVVGSEDKELDGKIIDENGSCVLDGAIVIDFASVNLKSFSVYNLKLTKLTTDAHRAKSIYCGAYIVDGTDVFYMGNTVTDKSIAVSYNSIYESRKEEE